MNVWLIAATVLLALLLPCLGVILFAGLLDALAALELGDVLATLALLALAQGFHRPAYLVLPLTLAVLSLAGGLVFLRFLGREL